MCVSGFCSQGGKSCTSLPASIAIQSSSYLSLIYHHSLLYSVPISARCKFQLSKRPRPPTLPKAPHFTLALNQECRYAHHLPRSSPLDPLDRHCSWILGEGLKSRTPLYLPSVLEHFCFMLLRSTSRDGKVDELSDE